jgi:hypothetical protein
MQIRKAFWIVFAVALIGVALFGLNTAMFIAENGANVPLRDEWEDRSTSYIAVKTASGQLAVADLFTPFHGHWIAPTKITTVLTTWLTRWDVRAEMAVGFGVATLTLILIGVLLWQESRWAAALALIPIAAVVYSHRQFQNWLWGLDNCWFYLNLFGVLAVWAAARQDPTRWRNRWGWMVLALLASISLGGGIVTWPIIALIVWVRGLRDWRFWGLWIGCMGAVYFAFAFNNAAISDEYQYGALTNFIGLWPGFFLALMGSLFVSGHTEYLPLSQWIGAAGIILFVFNMTTLFRRGERKAILLLVGLAALTLLGAGLLTITRAPYIPLIPFISMMSRFTTILIPFWAALFGSGAMVMVGTGRGRWIARVVGVLVVIGLAFAHESAIRIQALHMRNHIKVGQERCLTEYLITAWPDGPLAQTCLTSLSALNDGVEAPVLPGRIADMARLRLGAFATPPERPFNVGLWLVPGPAFQAMQIEGQTVQAFPHAPSTHWEQNIFLPDLAWRFSLAVGFTGQVPPGERLTYRISIARGGEPFQALITGEYSGGEIQRKVVGLNGYGGQRVRLRYELDGPAEAVGVWAAPRVVVAAPAKP